MDNRRNQKPRIAALVGVRLVVVCLLLVTGSPANLAASPAPAGDSFDVIELPSAALSAPPDLVELTPKSRHSKLDSVLAALASASVATSSQARAQGLAAGLNLLDDRVQVKIITSPGAVQAVTKFVEVSGGEVTGVANGETWLQAWLPFAALNTIATLEDVQAVNLPAEAVLMATTEGLVAMNAPAWHSAGAKGGGVKVAIIDTGFLDYPSLLGTELPSSVTVKNFVDGQSDSQVNGTTEHGAACAEIIHDVAPNAALYLVKVSTDIDLDEAVTWVKTQGADVISTSLGWYNVTPGDGTGYFADLVQSARDAGIFWATSAGNDREAHWGGAFNDSDSNNAHNFNGAQEINFFGPGDDSAYSIPSGHMIRAFLRWDDWTYVDQDYDLAIVRWDGSSWEVVASGTNDQTGAAGQEPTEFAAALTSGSSTAYGIVISRWSSTRNVNLELFAPKIASLDEVVRARSLTNLADAPAAMTVAALDVISPYQQEDTSSEGPTNGPGGIATGGASKPDISGYASVSTASYPDPANKFSGTSAAAPHVAGAAALIKGANPGYTPVQVRSLLESRATDMGVSGKDTIFGYGRLHLGDAPSPIVYDRKIYLPIAARPIPVPSLNAIDNDADGSYVVSWSAVASATTYTLQEATDPAFGSPATVYSGSNTYWSATDKPAGVYCYRVMASLTLGDSPWSNVQCTTVAFSESPITNGDFELGSSGWTEYSLSRWTLIVTTLPGSATCRSGAWCAWLGGEYDDISYVAQRVTVPATAPWLTYYHWIASSDVCGYDFGGVFVNGTVVDDYDLCDSLNTGGWVKHSADFSAYAGQTVDFQIRVETDGANNSSLFVDDVAFSAGAVPAGEDALTAGLNVDVSPEKSRALPQPVGEENAGIEETRSSRALER